MIEQEKLLSNPFPGLRPFRFRESELFFGRDGQSDQVLTKLRTARFVAVVGTSGSGKSSLVSAGVLPALYSGHMPSAGSGWRIATFRPGSSPIKNLAEALSAPGVCGTKDEAAAGERLENIERTLRRSSLGLLEVFTQSKLAPGENLLVLADQFEELFRFRKQSTDEHPEDEAAAFVKLLLETKQSDKSDQEKLPIYVILTMRSDYLEQCAHFWGLPEAINEGQFLIPRMTDDNRREAITGPVIIGGGEITAPLVNRLLNDAGDDPAQLPILQHALMRTWDHWKNRCNASGPIDISHYEAIGGITKALSNHADEAFVILSRGLRIIAGKVFKSLTEKEADNREGRRPATIGEIAAAAEANEWAVVEVVESFRAEGRSFLMPSPPAALSSDTPIDISHESLIRGWVRLREWVDQEADSARQYVRLAEKAALFPAEEPILRDPALSNGLKWLDDNRPTKAWAQRYHPGFDKAIEYLELSKANREAEIAAKEQEHKDRVERDLRHAEAIAGEQKRRLKQLRWGLVLLSLLLLGMFSATVYAFQQKNFAQLQKDRAEKSLKDVEVERDNARRAQEAEKIQKEAAEGATSRAEQERDNARRAKDEAARQRDLAEAQRTEAVKQEKIARAARIEADEQRELVQSSLSEANLARAGAERSEKEALMATEKANAELGRANYLLHTINEIDRAAPYFAAVIRGHGEPIVSAWMSETTRAGSAGMIITESLDQTAQMWDPRTAEQNLLDQPYLADRKTTPVLFSKSGKIVLLKAAEGFSGTAIWNIPERKELARLAWTDVAPANTLISPDDGIILHLDKSNNKISMVDSRTGQELRKLDRSFEEQLSTRFSPDSKSLVLTNHGSAAELWDVSTGHLITRLVGHLNEIQSLAFSPDSKFVVTASKDGTARIWDARNGNSLAQLSGSKGPVNSAQFSSDGKYIVTTSDRKAYLWEAKSASTWTEVTESSPTVFAGHTRLVSNAVFSPDGKWVVTISQDRTAQLWDAIVLPKAFTEVPASVAVFRGHIKALTSVEVSADSQYLVTGSEDRTARAWDLRGFGPFAITSVDIAASPPQYAGKCPAAIKFTGAILAQGRSGTVEYKFIRSDGSESLPQQLIFDGPDVQTVTDTRDVFSTGVSQNGAAMSTKVWVELQILKPEAKSVRTSSEVTCTDSASQVTLRDDLTLAQLQQIMPASSEDQRALYLPYLQKAMDEFGINTPLRRAAFLAEVAYNTTELQVMIEKGSDEVLEKLYGSRKDLGNFESGDGAHYKGRGAFLMVGRSQYQAFGAQLGVDLVADPEKAASPELAFRTAALFWQKNGLNERADQASLAAVHFRVYGSRIVPPGLEVYYVRAKRVLGVQ